MPTSPLRTHASPDWAMARAPVAEIRRASQKEEVQIAIDRYEPLVCFCLLLEGNIPRAAPVSADESLPLRLRVLQCFEGCENLPEVDQKIQQIKQRTVIHLSGLNAFKLHDLQRSYSETGIPAGCEDLFSLAGERKQIMETIQERDPASMFSSLACDMASMDFSENEFFKDDESLASAFIEWYKGLPKAISRHYAEFGRGHIWVLTNENLKNNASLILAIMREFPEIRNIALERYISPQLKENKEFMLALIDFFPEASHSASKELWDKEEFMSSVCHQILGTKEI